MIAFLVVQLLTGSGIASAHAVLMSTDPAANSVVPRLPAHVTLTFGESVQLPPHALRVFSPAGIEIDDGHPTHPGGRGAAVGIGLRPTSLPGSYTVAWRVISSDTHPVSGAFVFSVGHTSATAAALTAPAGGSTTVGVLYAIVRALAYGAYALLVGSIAFLLLCWPTGATGRLGPKAAATGWVVLVAATAATLLLQGPYGNGTGLVDMVDPGAVATTLTLPLGSALIARLLLLVATAVYLGQLIRRLPGATRPMRILLTAVWALLAVGLAMTWSLSGHAAVGLEPWIALPADVAHLIAMAVWLGGLVVLALALLRRTDDPGERALAGAVARFSPIAFGAVTVLVATGSYQSWRQLGSWSAFVDTAYGRILLIKICIVCVLLAVAAVSRRLVQRSRQPASPPRSLTRDHRPPARLARAVALEAALGALVLSLTAILVNAEPGRTAEAAITAAAQGPLHTSTHYDTGGPRGTGTLDVQLDPTRTGQNVLAVTVHGPSGALLDPPELDAQLSLPARRLGPLTVPLTRQSGGHYQATTQIPFPGTWQLALTVRTSDIDETTVRIPVPVPTS